MAGDRKNARPEAVNFPVNSGTRFTLRLGRSRANSNDLGVGQARLWVGRIPGGAGRTQEVAVFNAVQVGPERPETLR